MCAQRGQPALRRLRKPADAQLHPALDEVADEKGQKEHQRHDAQKDGDAPDAVGEGGVQLFGELVLPLFMHHHLVHDLVDEVVFLVDDVALAVQVDARQRNGVLFADLLVVFQQLDGVPALVGKVGVFFCEGGDDLIDLVFDVVRIHHGKFRVVVVAVVRYGGVFVHQRIGAGMPLVVDGGVQQNIQPFALPCGYGDDGDAQHLRQAVQVDLHAPLFDDVHHVQRHHHGLVQLQKLQGQIQAALDGGGVYHVDDHVYLVAEDKVARNRLFHRVRGQRVGAGQVHQADLLPVVFDGALHLFHRHPRPVRHLQICARIGVEQRRLAAVGVADKADGHGISALGGPFFFVTHVPPPRCFW